MRYFLFTICLLVAALPAPAQPAEMERLLEEANEAFRKRQYAEAIEGYEALLGEGYYSEALHYNLGNSYYRHGQLGKAILHYERARLLAPGDSDIRHNLAVARAALQDELAPLPEFFLYRWWDALRQLLSPAGWSLIGLLLLWAGAAGLGLWRLGRLRRHRKWGFVAGLSLLLLSVLPFALASSRQNQLLDSGLAVILSEETTLRSAPDALSQDMLPLHEGTTVELLDRIGDWYKVRLPNGEEGWLPMTDVEEV